MDYHGVYFFTGAIRLEAIWVSLGERLMMPNCIEHFVLSHALPFIPCLCNRKSFSNKRNLKLYPDAILLHWKLTNKQQGKYPNAFTQWENGGAALGSVQRQKQAKQRVRAWIRY